MVSWTPEKIGELRKLARNDHTFETAAAHLNLTVGQIAGAAFRYNVLFKGSRRRG